MANQAKHPKLVFRLSRSSMLGAALTLATLGTLAMVAMQPAQAQTFTVLHNFTGGADGESPYVGVTIAPSGVLYGTTRLGGTHGIGTAFRLTPEGSGWVFSPLYEFTGGLDGEQPVGGIAIGPNGVLYGTTPYAGINDGGSVRTEACGYVLQVDIVLLERSRAPRLSWIPGWGRPAVREFNL